MGYVICAGERVQVACPGPPPHTGGSGRGEVYGPNGGPSPTGKRTEVAFEKEIEFERGFGLFSSWRREKRIGDKVARFRQLNADKPNMHHDALEFPNGEIVLVTRLCEGQHATVLQLPASPHSVNDEVELKHAAVVG